MFISANTQPSSIFKTMSVLFMTNQVYKKIYIWITRGPYLLVISYDKYCQIRKNKVIFQIKPSIFRTNSVILMANPDIFRQLLLVFRANPVFSRSN